MSSSGALDNVITGKLKLKRARASTTAGGKKKRSKRQEPSAPAVVQEEKQMESEPIIISTYKTKAELKFEETRRNMEDQLIAKKIERTHRQKIEQFNSALENLSEHYDIPKVGPG